MQYRVNLDDVKSLMINTTEALEVNLSKDDGILKFDVFINPMMIDENFNLLENRINNIEAHLKLKYDGEIRNLQSKIENIEKNIYGKR